MIRAVGEDGKDDIRAARTLGDLIEISIGREIEGGRGSRYILLSVQDAFEFGRDLKELAEKVAKTPSGD